MKVKQMTGVLRIVVVATIIGISCWKHSLALAEEERLWAESEQRIQEEKTKADERPIAVPPAVAKKAKDGDLPEPDGIRRDELLADWLAQDSGVKVNEDFFAGDVAGRYRMALAKHGLAKEDGESWDAALSRYRAACMKRRAKRLAKVLAMGPRQRQGADAHSQRTLHRELQGPVEARSLPLRSQALQLGGP